MSRGEFIHKAIWSDPPFPSLSLEGQHLYLWSFTNPRCNMAGLYRLDIEVMTEAKVPRRKVPQVLDELSSRRMLYFEHDVLWVRARVRNLHSRHRNIAKAIASDVRFIRPEHPLRIAFLAEYGTDPWLATDLLPLNTREPEGYAGLEGVTSDVTNVSALESQKAEGLPRVSVNPLEGSYGVHAVVKEEPDGFEEWLEHHARTTGRTPLRLGTKVRAEVAASYAARRAEGYTLEELKLASLGAYNDAYRQEHGYFSAESVLRPTKVHDLIDLGRKRPKLQAVPNAGAYSTEAECRDCRQVAKLTQGRCRTCLALWEDKHLNGGDAA